MILTGPGRFVLGVRVGADTQTIDFASMTASEPSWVRVYLDGELVEDAFIGPYGSPHTWWPGNDLLGRQRPKPDDEITIELGPGVKMRIEGDIELRGSP